jgi:hypothetical protein
MVIAYSDNLLYAYCALVVAKLRGEDSLMTFKEIMEKYQITLTEVEKLSLELAGHRHYSIEGFMTQMWVRSPPCGTLGHSVAVPRAAGGVGDASMRSGRLGGNGGQERCKMHGAGSREGTSPHIRHLLSWSCLSGVAHPQLEVPLRGHLTSVGGN